MTESQQELADLQWVEDYFSTSTNECHDCPHLKSWKEPHGERLKVGRLALAAAA